MTERTFLKHLATLKGKFKLYNGEIRSKTPYQIKYEGDNMDATYSRCLCPIEMVCRSKFGETLELEESREQLGLEDNLADAIIAGADEDTETMSDERLMSRYYGRALPMRKKMLKILGLKEE